MEPIRRETRLIIVSLPDLIKTTGYLISSLSVLLLGMLLRWISYQLDEANKRMPG